MAFSYLVSNSPLVRVRELRQDDFLRHEQRVEHQASNIFMSIIVLVVVLYTILPSVEVCTTADCFITSTTTGLGGIAVRDVSSLIDAEESSSNAYGESACLFEVLCKYTTHLNFRDFIYNYFKLDQSCQTEFEPGVGSRQ